MALKTKKNYTTEIRGVANSSLRDSISRNFHKIDTAEGDFALRKFQSSLRLSNEILSSNKTTHSNVSFKDTRVVSLPNPFIEGGNYMNVRFSLHLGDDSELLQIQNRSCAIALQSSYELWKVRVSNDIKIDQHLLRDVTHALDFLMNSSGDPNATSLVHFDLISIYVEFCHAIGVSISLIPSILQLLVYFMELTKQDRTNSCTDEILYKGCYSLLHLLLVQILPFVHNQKTIEAAVESIEMLLQFGEVRLIDQLTELCTADTMIRKEPLQLATQMIHSSLTGLLRRESSMNSGEEALLKAVKEVLLDLKDIMDDSIGAYSPGLSSVVEEASDRLSKQINSRTDDLNQYENNNQTIIAWKNIMYSAIYDVWESEHRWLHRAKLVSGGLVVLAFWKQRRSVLKSGQYLGKALTSPVRELAAAFKPP